MEPQGRTADRELARLATRAHGVVTRTELVAGGITPGEIKRRLRTGALIPVYRGVYRVGRRAPGLESDYLAAVRACGDGAVLGGRAAGHLLYLLRGRPPAPEVIAPTERRVKGVTIRRCRNMHPREVTIWRGIPVTTVARTLVDLAALLSPDELARACHEAGIRHHTTPDEVDLVTARRSNAPGVRNLRQVLHGDVPVTLSKLEAGFLTLLRRNGLALPETNRVAGGRRVDCRWPERKLTVELDGYRYHRSRHAWEQDRRREREARARGDEFRRYTYGDVLEDPALMLAELRALRLDEAAADRVAHQLHAVAHLQLREQVGPV